ncbi:MAG TPA: PAS domain S-box protein [Candidatus Polarisedimenticolaceae bacterium]|nr:PAS domain S-box protein [Candidatus Polarisedimenticolaceae bacterium]
MVQPPVALAAGLFERANATALALGGLLGLVLLLALSVLLLIRSLARRSRTEDVTRLVHALEELRSGSYAARVDLDPGSPLSVVADAIHRAGHDVKLRLAEAAADRERLQLVMQAFQDSAVLTIDLDGDIRDFTESAEQMLGWSADEARGRPSSMIFEEDAFREFVPQLSRRATFDGGVISRSLLRRKNGSQFPAEVTVRPIRSKKGESTGFLMLLRDVTRQAGLEQELRLSEERHRRLVESLTDGVAIVSRGTLVYVNPAFSAMTGLPIETLIGTRLRDRVVTRDVLMIDARLEALELGGAGTDEMRCTLAGADDRPRADVRIHATSVEFEGGIGVLLLVHDETAARRIETELRRNESQLDAVLEATRDGMLVLVDRGRGGVVQMTNRAFLRIFGLREPQVLGQPEGRLIRALREREDGAAAVAELLASGTVEPNGRPVRLGGAAPKDLSVATFALVDRDGKRIGRVVVCRDTTRQRDAERELQQHAEKLQLSNVELERALAELDRANRDLASRTEDLGKLNRELQRLDELRQKLLGNLSHELQAPLVAIRGYTEMTLKERLGPITAEQRKGLTLSLGNIDRLIGLIDSLTHAPDLAELKPTTFLLRELIEQTADLLRREMQAKGIHFELSMSDDGARVQADRAKVEQVFINLLSNAIKFNKPGGSIEITVGPGEPRYLEVAVRDSGKGIPAADLPRVFDRHYRVATTGGGESGRGLGLAIVREILSLHGCRVRAESEPGAWTRVSFTLPRAPEGDREPDRRDAAEAGTPAAGDDEASASDRSTRAAPRPRFRVIRRYRRR